jgi:diacylglycerol kinase
VNFDDPDPPIAGDLAAAAVLIVLLGAIATLYIML